MRWPRIARKELRDATRTRSLFVAAALFAVLGGATGYFGGATGEPARALPTAALGLLAFFVPVVALGFSYEAVVSPRERGSLQFLLGLPFSRRDVLVGAYFGRLAIVWVAVLAGFAALALAALARGVVVSPVALAGSLAAVASLALAFVAIGVGLSAAVRSTQAAAILAFGCFLLVFVLWWQIPGLVAYALNGFAAPPEPPAWGPAFQSLNPVAAYGVLGNSVAAGSVGTGFAGGGLDSTPLAAAVLAGWATLPPLAGYLRFRDDDL